MWSEGLKFYRMQNDSDSYSLLNDSQASYNSQSPSIRSDSYDSGTERPWQHSTKQQLHEPVPFMTVGGHETGTELLPSKSAILKQISPEYRRVRPRSGTAGSVPLTSFIPLSALKYRRANKLDIQQEQKLAANPDKRNTNVFSIWSDPDDDLIENDDSPALSPTRHPRPQSDTSPSSKLKSAFQDFLGDVQLDEGQLVDWLKDRFEMQMTRIQRLERALCEKENWIRQTMDSLEISEESDAKMTTKVLLDRFPAAMHDFRTEVEAQVLDQQFDQLQAQKQTLLELQEKDYESIKEKYRQGFERIIQRLLSNPNRLEFDYAMLAHSQDASSSR